MQMLWVLVVATVALLATELPTVHARVVCYYDSRSYWREAVTYHDSLLACGDWRGKVVKVYGVPEVFVKSIAFQALLANSRETHDRPALKRAGKLLASDLEPALSYCTHLVYGYAKIDETTFKLTSLDEPLDLDSGRSNYHAVTNLKKRFPGLHVLLAVGGPADIQDVEKYLTLLETQESRTAFQNSARTLIRQYGFDGLDLAWQFPEIRVKKERGTFGSIWHKIKKTFGYGHNHVDEKELEHRNGFTTLVKDLKTSFKVDGLLVTAAVLPNVNASAYYDASALAQHLDSITLLAFDYKNPSRNPQQADYPSPLYSAGGRPINETADAAVKWWTDQGIQGSKIVLGISTYGRTWKLTTESQISGVPPLTADGPGGEGAQTKTPGLLSYPEICALIPNPNQRATGHLLRRVTDPSKKLGTYAFRLPDSEGEGGIWVAYEDPETAGDRATYVKNKGLGGVALYDISMDDFRGVCHGDKYPILKMAKNRFIEESSQENVHNLPFFTVPAPWTTSRREEQQYKRT
uniref:GH18 domain-containing protein n=1 Tax=Timema genevievae TaxID=629358 RepID=A0A7R9PM37_TIMGE|nr:unnamed protein product [Timema genevievae]